MKTECDHELNIYLASILKELITEKSQEKNTINQIMNNQKGIGSYSKWCKKYNMTNINNKKRTCSKCNEKLDTLAILQAKSTKKLTQVDKNIPSQSGTPIIKIYEYTQEKASYLEHISITQQSKPNQNVVIPEMHMPDLLEVNPNSLNNVKKVLEHIQSITEIDEGAFKNNKQSLLPRPIPITAQKEEAAISKENMKKDDLLVFINSLLNSINISDRPKYRGLKQKTRSQLLEILQSIKNLYNDQDEPENEIEPENK
ncbi:12308_t:CDS:2 [Dentiscutata heterogama]|uniref:12308_t:CDS:1 n=1 Tax=Dentiscutata heterogama TaxID=1316150 RepID=A0ACA9LDK8_9GLOM|nr:12308_t:CDS:2 [Dentiscutata heterogama]